MAEQSVLLTTTSVTEQVKLENYKGIVSARVVTGVDLFSDLFASFSDVFGGRSATYQKQLKSIYDEVMQLLTQEAVKLGANAIVGINIDHDEVSGKGKQMFMVTATGTAAYIPNYGHEAETEEITFEHEISFEKYQYEHKRLSLIYNVNQNYNHVPDYWPAILEYYPSEIMLQVFKYYFTLDFNYNNAYENVYQYFTGVDEEQAKLFLYDKLSTHNEAAQVLLQTRLTDYDRLEQLLASDAELNVKKCALFVLSGDKRKYNMKDAGAIERILSLVGETFVSRGHHDSDRWTCECGKVNKAGVAYCKSCDKDTYGFKKGEGNVEDTLAVLKERLFVLRNIFRLE